MTVVNMKVALKAVSNAGLSDAELTLMVANYRKLKAEAEKAQAALDAVKDALTAEMDARGVETYVGSNFKISYKTVISNRIDSTALKRELPEIAARYSKPCTSKRFTVS